MVTRECGTNYLVLMPKQNTHTNMHEETQWNIGAVCAVHNATVIYIAKLPRRV